VDCGRRDAPIRFTHRVKSFDKVPRPYSPTSKASVEKEPNIRTGKGVENRDQGEEVEKMSGRGSRTYAFEDEGERVRRREPLKNGELVVSPTCRHCSSLLWKISREKDSPISATLNR